MGHWGIRRQPYDWMRVADLPWCRALAARDGHFILVYRVGGLLVWISPESAHVAWNSRLLFRLWLRDG